MESPVRICLGAVLVVNLLLLSSTHVSGHKLPYETTPTLKDDRGSRRANSTWISRIKPKLPDVALNELQHKETSSEENTEKNAKYKDRGRVRFNILKSTTEASPRRIRSSTEPSNLIIVTPTPEVKKPLEIIDSMHNYKKTKLPVSSSTESVKAKAESQEEIDVDEDDEDEDDNEESESYEKYTSSKFSDSNFFTLPSFNGGYNKNNKDKVSDYSKAPFSDFSNFFSKHSLRSDNDAYKSNSFFDFGSELTTPQNDYFDKKFHEISSSILKNLDTIKAKSPTLNETNMQHKIVKENIGFQKLSNGTPHNKSTVIIHNTKEIRVMDNDKAGSSNDALSDVHGTSIYYEMSVLSTETYNITHSNDDDCDDEINVPEPTLQTPLKDEIASVIPTQAPLALIPTEMSRPVGDNEIGSTVASYLLPVSGTPFTVSSSTPVSVSYQNTVISSEKPTISSSTTIQPRSRNYSKRLNLTGAKESVNNIGAQSDQVSPNHVYRTNSNTRRFHPTTQKAKPMWMAPRRNVTRISPTRVPSTIYSEHFDIKNRFSTPESGPLSKILTTLPSDIDPVLQSDTIGSKKVVHSHSFVDNTIPSLWKRGSTKFVPSTSSTTTTTSTAPTSSSTTTTEAQTSTTRNSVSDFEIPPTLTAWALAGLRSPPSLTRHAVNSTSSTKSIDENELQNVGEIIDKRETTSSTTTTTSASVIQQDIILKNITEIDQNRLPWKPIFAQTSTSDNEVKDKATELISERVPAESNISLQNSEEPSTTVDDETSEPTTEKVEFDQSQSSWVASTINLHHSPTIESEVTSKDTIPPVSPTKSSGFESITKLPSDITTPSDDAFANSDDKNEVVQAASKEPSTEYEITTIRFSYVPTEPVTDTTEADEPTTDWHYAGTTRTKLPTTIEDAPITTYRPKYYSTTNEVKETSTIQDTTPQIEVSSQVFETTTIKELTTSSEPPLTTKAPTTTPIVIVMTTTEIPTTEQPKTTTLVAPTEPEPEPEAKTIVVSVATEINTEISTVITDAPTTIKQQSSEENVDFNEVVTQDAKPTPTEADNAETTTVKQVEVETTVATTTEDDTTEHDAHIVETDATESTDEETVETTTDATLRTVNELEDVTGYGGEMTTEASSRVLDETGSGAGIAIAVSTIGVTALILLIGLLLVVRRRGRRGVYAQRCTPVSLDAYSLDSVSVGHRKGNQRLRASKRSYGNPAYDDEVTSHPMNYAALANFALDIDSMSAEFAEIPTVTVRPEEVPPGCEDKNRYSNVLPLPETRVPLKRIANDPTTEYINANYITGPGNIKNYYIACQAPLSNTVVDFWRMIWEQNSRVVVMLTEYLENGVEKCYEYLPPSEISDNRRTFGEYQIILKKREQRDKYAISSVQLINLATRTWREVTHLWYFWPAKGVPDDYDSVIDFLSEMRSYMKVSQTAKEYDEEGLEVIYEDQNRSSYNNLSKLRSDEASGNGVNVYSPARAEAMLRRGFSNNGTLGKMKSASEVEGVRPCVVVCASGAGRAAALVAADVCARALAAGAADLPRTVRALRTQRPHSLTNRHHYIFLYRLLSEYGNRLMGGGIDTI